MPRLAPMGSAAPMPGTPPGFAEKPATCSVSVWLAYGNLEPFAAPDSSVVLDGLARQREGFPPRGPGQGDVLRRRCRRIRRLPVVSCRLIRPRFNGFSLARVSDLAQAHHIRRLCRPREDYPDQFGHHRAAPTGTILSTSMTKLSTRGALAVKNKSFTDTVPDTSSLGDR